MTKGRKDNKPGDTSSDAAAKTNKVKSATGRDPLIAAREYVEGGQHEEAIYVLELAVLAEPNRKELQEKLLSLYRSTYNEKAFYRFYNVLIRKRMILSEEWSQLKNFFKGLGNEPNQ